MQYGQHLIDQLNELILGTVDEDQQTKDLHVKYAHRSDKAHLYNVSAMLTFTDFFWKTLTESEDPSVRKPGLVTTKSIQKTFGDVQTLREEMLETADSIFGNGFVWLMKGTSVGDMKILATYNAGSPYPAAAPRRDDRDMATFRLNSDEYSGQPQTMANPETRDILIGNSNAGFFGDHSASSSRHYKDLLNMGPILCVNVWQHMWIRDYGLTGKKSYLVNWWDRIDWQKVEAEHNQLEMGSGSYYSQSQPQYSKSGGSSVWDAVPRYSEEDVKALYSGMQLK